MLLRLEVLGHILHLEIAAQPQYETVEAVPDNTPPPLTIYTSDEDHPTDHLGFIGKRDG